MIQKEYTIPKILKRFQSFRYILVLEGILVGAAAGLVTVLFRVTLEHADSIRNAAIHFVRQSGWTIALWFFLLLIASIMVTFLLKWEPLISGSGIPQVEGEMQGRLRQKWWRVLIAKFLGGVLSIGAGLSLGREGPSIQLGAMAGKGVSKLSRRARTEERLLMTCGASAGLAAAFNAPLAGVLFSLEELHKDFSVEVLLSTMSASVTADFISRNVFGLKPVFQFSFVDAMPLFNYWQVILLGIIIGLLGVLYNKCIEKSQSLYDKIKQPFVKIGIPFMVAGILGFVYPSVLGGGHNLVGQVAAKMELQALLVLFVIKFLFSMMSFGSGAPGGIFLPLLVLGAVVGGSFSGLLSLLGIENELQIFIILGMAGFFAAIVRSPVTGIILISEMTGGFSHLLTLSLISLTAYAVADLMKAKPIYDQLLLRLLSKRKSTKKVKTGQKVLIESPVQYGAPVCGKRLKEIVWPADSLIVSVQRGEEEFVPRGDTRLTAGDHITVLCDESITHEVHDALEEQLKSMEVKDYNRQKGGK